MLFRDFPRQQLPQPRLPVRRRAPLPVPDPVRPEVDATVIDRGQLVGKLESLALVPVGKELPYFAGFRRAGELREQFKQMPAQIARVESPGLRQSRNGVAQDRPGKLGRQLEIDIRGDAQFARQFEPQPAAHRLMRHDDSLRREGLGRIGRKQPGQFSSQLFKPIRMINAQVSAPNHLREEK